MSKEYANRKKPAQRRRQTKTQPKPQGLPGWLWLLVGMTFGLVIAVMLYVFNGPDSGDRALPSAPAPRASTPPPTPEPELPPKEEARFTFYEMLPNFQLVPRTEKYTPAPAPAADLRYAIQAGSCARQGDAETRRAEIALLGIESRVESAQLDDGRTVYRVIIGPESNFNRVKDRMARLYENGIESFFRRLDS